MKILAAVIILGVSLQPYIVWADSAAAAAAAASGGSASAAAAAATSTDDPSHGNRLPCSCPLVYDPVCGTDGNTYSNECFLKCVSDHKVLTGWPPIKTLSKGECPQSLCNCPAVVDPICGKNNHTYANECYLRCDNKWRKKADLPLIDLAYRGRCKQPACICPDVIIPVCGTDGKTYRNVCVLKCYSHINEEQCRDPIRVDYKGACKNESCICPYNYDPICASDEVTYSNLCVFRCQNRRRDQLGLPPLTIQYKGKCIDCICPAVYDPVCASDGKTYGNLCLFKCENRKREARCEPPLKIIFKGECTCTCNKQYDPVCASDKRTYNNKCLLRCENERRARLGLPPLIIKHYGRCICSCKHCPPEKNEVCGSDRNTYWNRCWLNCFSQCNINAGYPPIYRIKNGPC